MTALNMKVQLLLDEMSEGSSGAFDIFYEKYMPLVYRISLQMMKDQMEAEDVCHDVFIEVMNKPWQFNSRRGSVEAWLAVKTRCRCIDQIRRKQRFRMEAWEEEAASYDHGLNVEDAVVDRLEQSMLHTALEQIPQSQKNAIYGAYYEDQSQRELAERMKRPIGTVKSLIRYGIQNLKKQFQQGGWIETSRGSSIPTGQKQCLCSSRGNNYVK
jgi:RNA polymerase sigma factor (sigma-70 family)